MRDDDLKACRAALRVCRSLPARPETTAAWDRALVAVEEVLSGSVNGSAATPTRQTEWVTTAEAAKALGCTDRWARDIAASVGIKYGGRWFIPKDALPQPD